MQVNKSGLYLCLFDQGTLKVGRATNPKSRLTSHKAAGSVFGISVIKTDVIPCDNEHAAEKMLIDWCALNSETRRSREWFTGIDYAQCLETAKMIAALQIGPYQKQISKSFRAIDMLDNFSWRLPKPITRESSFYLDARKILIKNQHGAEVISGLDYLHLQCEKVRESMKNGATMPDWYDALNCFQQWEIDLFDDGNNPSSELLHAIADALDSIKETA